MSRSFVVLALAVLLLAGLAVFSRWESRREDPPRETGAPSPAPGDPVAALRERIRSRLGADPEAIASLAGFLPGDPGLRVAWLRENRAVLDLAIRSDDPHAGARALGVLSEALSGADPDVRTLLSSPAFREVWLRAVSGRFPALRAAAAAFLGRLGEDRCRSLLAALLADPDPGVRLAAVRAYADLSDRPGAARLAALFENEEDARVRLAVLDAFGRHRRLRGPDARRVERAAIAGKTSAERIQGMQNLGKYRDQDALAAVAENLPHADPAVRRAALRTLARLRDPRALPALRDFAAREKDAGLKEQALALIRTLGG